jgi:hypothetical protein
VAEVVTKARCRSDVNDTLEALRLHDMPRLGFVLLREEPGVEVVYGQISQPWETTPSEGRPVEPPTFAKFSEPGFAKIVFSLAPTHRSSSWRRGSR